ncbi:MULTISPECIES: exo-beta-N-acetylmuramidase NamZ domain-containing protein [Pseudoalteromonas]|uniref:DUF1343 domain-containing protein n=1 Tax=Pseudoalteromonas amylolytica TaxID=1859457 RepID=A0A1S1MTH8_9GAMM|nr:MULTISPECIES: DUF1343 domain-containing protein [Pseudoalteromonas]OHU89159.1 hypothetical protein BFC16_05820 [Pseudoalteromonas sp. JW3]OHU92059.1 hypothetical protein BET10_06925 [Pseudoalteromonas amylolytica]
MRCFIVLILLCVSASSQALQVGAERYSHYLPLLKGQRVALVVNQTAQTQDGHLLDSLLAKGVDVRKVFAPEHGFRGDHDAGAKVDSGKDAKTGLPIVSLYGKNKKPSTEALQDIDTVVFDIQDVGVRFYTYISTMHYVMEASAEHDKQLLILDRPNPNIAYVDGPVLEAKFRSFVGMHPIPVLHGMTVGELAKMIYGEGWLKTSRALDLKVISIADYNASMGYELPIKPSPNLPNAQAIALYPSLCFFEATPVSVGRGTPMPFQIFGHDSVRLGTFSFAPKPVIGAAANPKLNGKTVYGKDLRQVRSNGLNLNWFLDAYKAFYVKNEPFFTHAEFMDKLAGTDKLRLAIEAKQSVAQIKSGWQADLEAFKLLRQPYLIYKR